MADYSEKAPIRVPNLPFGQIVDDKGVPTDDELTFRQALIGNLQRLFGNEGVVLPSLTTAQITEIENNQSANGFTCAYGTLVYDSTVNQVKVAINIGNQPVFKVIPYTP